MDHWHSAVIALEELQCGRLAALSEDAQPHTVICLRSNEKQQDLTRMAPCLPKKAGAKCIGSMKNTLAWIKCASEAAAREEIDLL